MSYTGISTREAKLESLLTRVCEVYEMRELFGPLATEVCETLDAKCGLHFYRESETMQRGGVCQGITYPCILPAGHSGLCVTEDSQ